MGWPESGCRIIFFLPPVLRQGNKTVAVAV